MFPFLRVGALWIPMYGLMIVAACALVALLTWTRCKKLGCSRDDAFTVLACAGGMAILGAKALYLVTSVPFEILFGAAREGRLLDLVAAGGQVFYGGAIGGAAGACLGLRITRAKAEPLLRVILPTIPLGHALGRIGCFFAGCCYGIPHQGLLSVIYTHPVGGAPTGIGLFPVQCLEALLNVAVGLFLLFGSKQASGYRVTLAYLMLYGVERFLLEFLRYDAIRGGIGLFSTSQWISIGMVLVGGLLFLWMEKTKAGPQGEAPDP